MNTKLCIDWLSTAQPPRLRRSQSEAPCFTGPVSGIAVTHPRHTTQHLTTRSFTCRTDNPLDHRPLNHTHSTPTNTSSSSTHLLSYPNSLIPTPSPAAPTTPSTPAHYNTPLAICTNTSFSSTHPLSDLDSLLQENTLLKEEIKRLQTELKSILDHAIESDQRLSLHTSEIFASATSQSSKPVKTNDGLVQCDPIPLTTQETQTLPVSIPVPDHSNEIIDSLKTTVEVLEAEIECLQLQQTQCVCKNRNET
ncbi:hypothetical protein J6590_089193 [Homalodisca vitripennis]|nr:hypothetical protein J6590_089193 [Homalodisca vitripennis]